MKQLPKAIPKRISEISSNESVFNKSILIYTEVLVKGTFNESIKYTPKSVNKPPEEKKRKRKTINELVNT